MFAINKKGDEFLYKALYRKWRSSRFKDVIGQEPITTTLKNQIINEQISHAYIFTGTRGTGKTSCAKILAKAVNCLNNIDGEPCGVCEVCDGIEKGSIMDVVEMDAASNNKVDDIRFLKEELQYTPSKTKYRVYIIDEVHMLSISAFNSLLKVMEEPPSYVIFILATTEIHKVPTTILSRCQRYDFKRIKTQYIKELLLSISKKEDIKLLEDGANAIALISDGGMRDALSMLDLLSSGNNEIDEYYVKKTCGIADKEHIFFIIEHISNKSLDKIILKLNEIYQDGATPKFILEQMLIIFRNILISQFTNNYYDLIGCLNEEKDFYETMKKSFSKNDIIFFIEILTTGIDKMINSVSKKIDMEIAVIKIFNGNVKVSEKVTPKDKSKVIKVKEETNIIQAQSLVNKVKEPLGEKGELINEPAVSIENWGEIVSKIIKQNPAIGGVMADSLGYKQGEYVLIKSSNEVLFKLLRQSANARDSIRQVVQDIMGYSYKLGPYKNDAQEELVTTEDPINGLIDKVLKDKIEYIES
ncbi:MAG: DNA polymerase III subunit gamma/tau [Oscillospiraceae bacterium]